MKKTLLQKSLLFTIAVNICLIAGLALVFVPNQTKQSAILPPLPPPNTSILLKHYPIRFDFQNFESCWHDPRVCVCHSSKHTNLPEKRILFDDLDLQFKEYLKLQQDLEEKELK